MPINIPDGLPAIDVLQRENIFCITLDYANLICDIRVILLLINFPLSLLVPPNPLPDNPAFLGVNKFDTAVP